MSNGKREIERERGGGREEGLGKMEEGRWRRESRRGKADRSGSKKKKKKKKTELAGTKIGSSVDQRDGKMESSHTEADWVKLNINIV